MILPRFFPITPLWDPFSQYFDGREMDPPNHYLHVKFGENQLVNKNFTAQGVSKNVIFPCFSQLLLVGPLFRVLRLS